MAPALTCVLLAQLAAASVLRPVPPQAAAAPRVFGGPPVHIIHVPTLRLAPGAAPRAGVDCPVRMRTADPSLDPGMTGPIDPSHPAAAADLDPHIAVNANCAVNVDAEASRRK